MKIDLEKAYDQLDWNFLYKTLLELGLSRSFCDLIISCVSLSSFQVLFNGGKESFTPTRGIIQGDPISPYLFVMCIERLAHRIKREVESAHWKLVQLSRGGPLISHIFFVDDLLLFWRSL